MSSPHDAELQKAQRLIRHFRASIGPTVPAQVVQAFLTVAIKEGQSLTEIAEKLDAKLSTASRHMLDLGERNRRKQPGYKLVKRTVDPMNLRVSRYTLTQKGKLLAQSIAQIMEE